MFVFPDALVLHRGRFETAIKKVLEKNNVSTVICTVFPFSNYNLVPFLKRNQPKIKLVIDIGDPLLGNSAYSPTGSLNKKIRKLEGDAIQQADWIVVTNDGTKKHFMECYGDKLNPGKITVIPNGTNDFIFQESISVNTGPHPGPKKIVYAGTFYPKLREPYPLFDAIKSFQNNEVSLHIYGPKTQFINENEIDGKSIIFWGLIPYDRMSEIYRGCDILVFIDNAYGVQTSGKVYELIAARKPLLFIYESETSPTVDLIKTYPGAIRCKNREKDIRDGIFNIINKNISLSFQFDITPFLWSTRAREFDIVIE